MSDYRIIVYNVELPELEIAIAKATTAYRQEFGNEPKTLTVPPGMVVDAQKLIDINDLPLEIDRFFASGGTIQTGE
jgi:hypothetical protein